MAHNSSGGHVGYTVWPQIVGSHKNPGMPSQYLMCPEVAISQRIHLWEGKSASMQKFQRFSGSLWAGTLSFGGVIREDWCCDCANVPRTRPAVGCPGLNSRRSSMGWCRRSIGERSSWLFPLGYITVQGCWMLPRSPGSHGQGMFYCNPSWHVGSWSHQHTNWSVGTSGWPLVWIAIVEVCRR